MQQVTDQAQTTQGSFHHSCTYDGATGEVLKQIKHPYRWTLRHMREVRSVAVVEWDTGSAAVYVELDDAVTMLCHMFGSYALAKQRYGQWADEHGFSYTTWDYPAEA